MRRPIISSHTVEWTDGFDVTFVVTGNVEEVIRGVYHGPPEMCYEDEGGGVEITSIKGKDSKIPYVTSWFTEGELSSIEEALFEEMERSRPTDIGPFWAVED